MIKNGGWGFSYGFMPAQEGGIGRKCIGEGAHQECYSAFVKGFLYEISVVDAPAHMDAVTHVIERMMNGHKGVTMSAPQGSDSNLANKSKGEKKNLEKAEVEQMFTDFETRMTKKIEEALGNKKTNKSIEDQLKGIETRLQESLTKQLAEMVPAKEPSHLEKTFTGVQTQVATMDKKITELKTIEAALKKAGEDNPALAARITQLETEREALSKSIVTSVEGVVRGHVAKLNERMSALENAPAFNSPAGVPQGIPVHRGFGTGFRGQLEAAFGGGQ